MGINGAHFNGAANATVMPVTDNACNDVWPQYSWQASDRVSRDDLAQEIANAEQDIADAINYWPAPVWVAQEVHPYPRHHRPDVIQAGGYDVRGYHKAIITDYGYLISPGQRATASVCDAAVVVYSDEDGDGVMETATVSVATSLTDECEVKVYFEGYGGIPEWEIRPARTKTIAGGTFTATFWKWQFIDPDLWDALTTVEGQSAIDWTIIGNVVATVDVYREYTDTTAVSAQFYWEPKSAPLNWIDNLNCGCGGSGCEACGLTTQTGCLHIRQQRAGLIVPAPATYSDVDAAWSAASWSVCRDPDLVKLWYYAGFWDNRKRRGDVCEPLSRWWQETIAWLATARLERPFCSCANVTALAIKLQTDLSLLSAETSFNVSETLLSNPFGTRRGEVMAWKRVSKLVERRMMAAVV